MNFREVLVGGVTIGGGAPLAAIAGPCVIESAEGCFDAARLVKAHAAEADVPIIFKASFDKANRTHPDSYRGPGLDEGLAVLAEIRRTLGLPVTTDVHEPWQAEPVGEVVDLVQIPALLCRQTDLLVAAGRTGKPVNVKKGPFMAPDNMRGALEKIHSTGNHQVLLTERGTTFGYHDLVVDFRAIPRLRALGVPVVFDGTHVVQRPGWAGNASGGERELAPMLLRAAVAAGVDAVFMETHPDPDRALSDGPTMIRLDELALLLAGLRALDELVRDEKMRGVPRAPLARSPQ